MAASYRDRLERMNLIVTLLPGVTSQNRGRSAKDLLPQLEDQYGDSKSEQARLRSVQRDLNELCKTGRIQVADPSAKPFQYQRIQDHEDADPFAWDYTLQQIKAQLKDVVSSRQLEAVLTQLQGADGGHVLDDSKLRIIPDTLRLKPADILPAVLTEVLRALAHNQVVEVSYRDREGTATTPRLHPQGMLQRGPRVYLFALKDEETDVRMYALHRMTKATASQLVSRKAEGFDLEGALYNGQADFAGGEQIILKALIRGYVETLLYECPLNDSQRLEAEPEGSEFNALLTVELPASGQLLRWLLGCGSNLKVLWPEKVQFVVASQVKKMAALYE